MIPLGDVIPSRTPPVVTIALVGLNTAVFLYAWSLGDRVTTLLAGFGLVPAEFSAVRLITSMFLHAGLLHFGGNMIVLWIFGDNLEDRMGHGRFLVFYLLCGAVAALAHTAMRSDSHVPVIGASGAVAGVMGAYFVLYPRSKVVTLLPLVAVIRIVEVPAFVFLGLWWLVQFASGLASGMAGTGAAAGSVAFWAHVAGFAAGAGGVMRLIRPERLRVEWWDDV